MYYFTTYLSPLGPLRLISDGEHLTALSIEKQKYACSPEYREALQNSSLPVFQETIKWLAAYFAKEKHSINALPLSPEGSAFRQEIWRLLCEIPYGQVTTYGCLARQAAVNMEKKAMSAQAVGGAVGHNPIPIIIPCHRVVGSDGSLTGFSAGIEKKIWLLRHEGLEMSEFTVPTHGTAL